MVWPLDIRVQIAPGADPAASPATWDWVDISDDVPIQPYDITRGRADEQGATPPSQIRLQLDNQDGRFTPGLASSPFYPHVRQGLPLRVSVGHPPVGVAADTDGTTQVAPSVTATEAGVLICAWYAGQSGTLTPPGGMTSLGQTDATVSTMGAAWEQVAAGATGTRSAAFTEDTSGMACSVVIHGADGVSPTVVDSDSAGAQGEALTLEVDAVAGQWLVAVQACGVDTLRELPSAPLDGAEWVPLVDHPTGPLEDLFTEGRILAWARPVTADGPQVVTFGTTPIRNESIPSDSHALLVVVDGAGLGSSRFTGHVGEIVPSWPLGDISVPEYGYPGESEVQVTAGGPLRRLGQGRGVPQSTYWWWARDAYRTEEFSISRGQPLAYWPVDDGPGARHEAAAAFGPHGLRLRSHVGAPTRIDTSPRPGETELAPHLGTGAELRRGYALGPVVMPQVSGMRWAADMVFRQSQLSDDTAGFIQLLVYGTGTGEDGDPQIQWALTIGPASGDDPEDDPTTVGMTRTVREGSTSSTATLATPLEIPGLLPGELPHHVSVRVRSSGGGNAVWEWWLDGVLMQSGTVSSAVQPVGAVMVGGTARTIVFGQVAVWDYWPSAVDAAAAAHGWPGEEAVARVRRVAREQGVPVQIIGELEGSTAMGPQEREPLLDVLQDVADTDGGILYETTSGVLAYRPRRAMYSQRCHLDIEAGDGLQNPFVPVLDDQGLRNDVTARRSDGGQVQATAPEHIAVHGEYSTSVTLAVASDAQLGEHASWRVHLGTTDGMRYPSLSPDLNTNSSLIPAWAGLTLGDRVCVHGLPVQHPAGEVDLLVQGYSETITPDTWVAVANTSPGQPWRVGVTGDEDAPAFAPDAPERVDTAGSELAVAVDAEAILLDVVTTDGPRWITTAEHPALFPFDLRLGEEIVRATAISDGTPPYTGAGGYTESTSTDIVCPSVDAAADSLLIVGLTTFNSAGAVLTLPGGMTGLGGTGGGFSVMAAATEPVGAGATGTRTITSDQTDVSSTVSIAVAGDGATPTVVESAADIEVFGDATVTTSGAPLAGDLVVAVHGWDWDPDDIMGAATLGAGWLLVADTLSGGANTSRTRVWARRLTEGGAVSATGPTGPGVSDSHLRLVVVRGVADGTIGQAVTVIRGVGGQPGPHPSGAPVRLAYPAVVAL
ncbi:hypothetical protein [Nocardiopsis protaetiae]|uniref:hypothetical protein n=1 Tax=Nocardiopsis protaetiae TaxID=3382270 RepID=UPI00387AEFB6